MIVLHDELGSETATCQAMGEAGEEIALFDYVVIGAPEDGAWVGQVVQPNRNISTVSRRLDPVVLHGLQLMQEHVEVQSVRSVPIFEILLLGEYDGKSVASVRRRPLPGSGVQRLAADQTRKILEIPDAETHPDGSQNVVGMLLNAENVPLCINPLLFNHHFFVVGGTGAGKSNVNANLISQAAHYGKCVLIHDAKPDYGWVGRPNTDNRVESIWPRFADYGLVPCGAANVHRLGFYKRCEASEVHQVIGFRASDFTPEMLAGFFFPGNTPAEMNAFEAFAGAADALLHDKEREAYNVDDILTEVKWRGEEKNADQVRPEDQIHPLTAKSICRKVQNRKRSLPWLDAVGQDAGQSRGFLTSSLDGARSEVSSFRLADAVKAGRILHIDYSRMDESSYALILSYFLGQSHACCRTRAGVGLVQLVDEAHRIFDNDTRHSGRLGSAFARVMREGRSLDHSVILSLQNATQIPPRVMGNLNSKIVMRQNSKEEAQAATQTMGREFADQAMSLGTGQALVSLFESRAVVLAQMAPSPYELQRTDNSRRPTLGEEE